MRFDEIPLPLLLGSGPFKITYDNRVAVEYCVIAEASITVDQNTVANKGQLPKLITEEYSTTIRLLDTSLFESHSLRRTGLGQYQEFFYGC
jgi:hypothetical protein